MADKREFIDMLFGTDLKSRYDKKQALSAVDQLEKERQGRQTIDDANKRNMDWLSSLSLEDRAKAPAMSNSTSIEGLGDLGNFNFNDRARELGLTGKYSAVPEVQNYLAEPNKTKLEEQTIQSNSNTLDKDVFDKNLREGSTKALTAFNTDLQSGMKPREAALKNNLPSLTQSEGVRNSLSSFMNQPEDLENDDTNRKWHTSEREAGQTFQSGENEKNRENNAKIATMNLNGRQDKKDFTQENQLRTQFDGLSKDFISVRDAYKRVKTSTTNPSPAGDLALIFNYMKMLDPGSTVREGEFANAAASGSYGDRFQGAAQKILSGKRLSDKQRMDFLKSTEDLFNQQKDSFSSLKNKYNSIATEYGLNPDLVTGGFDLENQQGNEKQFKSIEEAEKANLPKGTVIYIGGRKAMVE